MPFNPPYSLLELLILLTLGFWACAVGFAVAKIVIRGVGALVRRAFWD